MNFFITNREIIEENDKEFIRADGKERGGDNLRFGEFDGTEFILYKEPTQQQDIFYNELGETETLKGSSKFFKKLYEQINESKVNKTKAGKNKADVLFFIHGFNTDLEGVKNAFKNLNEKYVNNVESPIAHIVIFSFPGRHPVLPLHYRNDQHDAQLSGETLYRGILKLHKFFKHFFNENKEEKKEEKKNEVCGQKIHLMAHSMGNQVLGKTLTLLGKQTYEIFGEIILVAADIEYNVFEKGQPFENLIDMGERVHIYYNTKDRVLDISKYTKNFNNRLGRYGRKYVNPAVEDIYDVDVTEKTSKQEDEGDWQEKTLNHWYYYSSEEAVKDIIRVLNGEVSKFVKNKAQGIFKI